VTPHVQTPRSDRCSAPCAAQIPLKFGWLYKRGKVVRNWRKRWFSLTQRNMTYADEQVCC
jgi:hypothetical protein